MPRPLTWFVRLSASATAAGLLLTAAVCTLSRDTQAASKLSSHVTFQRVIDDTTGVPEEGPSGTATLTKNGDQQSLSIKVQGLPGEDFGLLWSTEFGTNGLADLVAVLDSGASNGTWQLKLQSSNGIPPPLTRKWSDIEDMAGFVLQIAQSKGVTNDMLQVDLFLQGLVLPLTGSPVKISSRASMTPPPDGPNAGASGLIKVQFQESTGRSLIDVRVKKMLDIHNYQLLLEDPAGSGSFTNLVSLTMTGSNGRYIRDTKRGDTLPFGSACVTNLSGRALRIIDAFGEPHLGGVIP